jgi:hypothetical protein
LVQKEFNIQSVNNIERLISTLFTKEKYDLIKLLILENELNKFNDNNSLDRVIFREYLEVMKCSDQNRQPYIIVIYDSDELIQDPEIIDIFKITA